MASTSWLKIDPESPFSLANIPFGIITTATNGTPRPAIAIGQYALDLEAFTSGNGFSRLPSISKSLKVFSEPTLNAFAALGQSTHSSVRKYIQQVFTSGGPHTKPLEENKSLQQKALLPLNIVKTRLPMSIGDYTDFYAGRNHAYNVGVMFRGKDNALQPNYEHIPVGCHGRASSVVVSGTSITILAFLAAKAHVLGMDRNPPPTQFSSPSLPTFAFHHANLTDPSASSEIINTCKKVHGPKFDILLNVASVMGSLCQFRKYHCRDVEA